MDLLCLESGDLIYCIKYLQVPHVNRTDYQLIDISEDGFVRLLSFNYFSPFWHHAITWFLGHII